MVRKLLRFARPAQRQRCVRGELKSGACLCAFPFRRVADGCERRIGAVESGRGVALVQLQKPAKRIR